MVVAQALGWQFVPVRSDVEVTADGYVFPVRRDMTSGRVLAWSSVAKYIESRYRDGDHGYKNSYGSRANYVSGYRSGYEEGYRRGFSTRTNGRYRYDDGRVIREYPRW